MPDPRKPDESHEEFMRRCMSYMADNHPEKKREEKVAICMSMARRGGERKDGK
jgi:hypothetical protein